MIKFLFKKSLAISLFLSFFHSLLKVVCKVSSFNVLGLFYVDAVASRSIVARQIKNNGNIRVFYGEVLS